MRYVITKLLLILLVALIWAGENTGGGDGHGTHP
jgi:hypothetical protein